MTPDPKRDCQHGLLKGKCDACARDEEMAELRAQLAEAKRRCRALEAMAETFVSSVDAVSREWARQDGQRGGQHVPCFSPFARVTPSQRNELQRMREGFAEALAGPSLNSGLWRVVSAEEAIARAELAESVLCALAFDYQRYFQTRVDVEFAVRDAEISECITEASRDALGDLFEATGVYPF